MEYIITKTQQNISMTKKVSGWVFPTTLKQEIESLKDGRYTMDIKQIRATRTVQQNKFYWACLWLIAEETGYLLPEMAKMEKKEIVEALHEQFKERILWSRTIRSTKDRRRKLKIPATTTTLDTHEFSKEYMDVIKRWHPYLPSPEDRNLLEFIDRYYYK